MNIINVSDLSPNWCWLKDDFEGSSLNWHHFSSQNAPPPKFLPNHNSLNRSIAAWHAVSLSKKHRSIVISHGPRPTFYCASMAFGRNLKSGVPHLAYSFNFTDLPTGLLRKLMIQAYRQPQRFVTYSTMEQKLYAEYFDIPIERIDMLHWAVHEPKTKTFEPPIEAGRYICAIGTQGRDYKTLFTAIEKIPHITLVIVAGANCLSGLNLPINVKIYTNISLGMAHNILVNSSFMVLPLRDSVVPCGHVTAVSAMFFGKAIIATDSIGIQDYVFDGNNGLLVEPKNPHHLMEKILLLWEDRNEVDMLAINGLNFARSNCTEKTVINYFENFLKLNSF